MVGHLDVRNRALGIMHKRIYIKDKKDCSKRAILFIFNTRMVGVSKIVEANILDFHIIICKKSY